MLCCSINASNAVAGAAASPITTAANGGPALVSGALAAPAAGSLIGRGFVPNTMLSFSPFAPQASTGALGGPAMSAPMSLGTLGAASGFVALPDPKISTFAMPAGLSSSLGSFGAGANAAPSLLSQSFSTALGTQAPANGGAGNAAPVAAVGDGGGATAQAVHMTQFAHSKYLKSGKEKAPLRSGNCAIVSTVMGLRMAGLDIKGFNGEKTQDVLSVARRIATGANDIGKGTTAAQVRKLISESGASSKTASGSASQRLAQAMEWAKQGKPVVFSGNAANAWNKRFTSSQVSHFNGRHSVLLSYDKATGKFMINDPLSKIGAFATTQAEMLKYLSGPTPDGYFLGDAIVIEAKRGR